MRPGRNDPCPCGSGRKYKHCCGSLAAARPPAPAAPLAVASELLQAGRLAQAESAYRRILEREPGNPQATHYLGITLFRSGRVEEGLDELKRSLALAPAEPVLMQNFGLILAEAGRYEEAESCFRRLLSGSPGLASAHDYLGMTLQQQGRLAEAIQAYRVALAHSPEDASVHNNYGFALLVQGEIDAAIEHLLQAARLDPRNAMAHNNLGNALKARGDTDGAWASYVRAIEVDPRLPLPRCNLGAILIDQGRPVEALMHLRAAVAAAPADAPVWQRVAEALARLRFEHPDAETERDLLGCLVREDVEPAYLAPAAASLLRSDTSIGRLLQAGQSEGRDARFWFSDETLVELRRPLFLALLEGAVLPELDFEILIAAIRRAALEAWRSGELEDDRRVSEVLGAIAHQCFLCEYVHARSGAEEQGVDRLRELLESIGPQKAREVDLALFAAYRPLSQITGSKRLDAPGGSIFGRLVLRQVREPQEERRIAAALRELTPVCHPVSLAVQTQYEQNPYPRWLRAPSLAHGQSLALALHSLFPHLRDAGGIPERPQILIAGCGTGRHALITAALNPHSRIVAVDLSRASLAFAERRARGLGVRNVSFALADVLELGSVEERFDLIECVGVLHHLGDALAGWRVLRALLKVDGYMKIGLYSEAARRGVVAARRLIAAQGFGADAAGIRAARAAISALPQGDAARTVVSSLDFYSLSGCRDLLFHVQEQRFDARWIAAAIAELGLQLLGFEFEDAGMLAEYRRCYPLDASATSLDNWAAFEAQEPDTFSGMYQFWVRQSG